MTKHSQKPLRKEGGCVFTHGVLRDAAYHEDQLALQSSRPWSHCMGSRNGHRCLVGFSLSPSHPDWDPSSMGWNLLSLVKPLTDIHNGVSPRWFLVSPSEQWRLIITGGTKTFTGWWDHTPLPWRTWDRFPAPVVDALHLLVWPQLLKPSLDLYGHLHMCGIHSHRHAPR